MTSRSPAKILQERADVGFVLGQSAGVRRCPQVFEVTSAAASPIDTSRRGDDRRPMSKRQRGTGTVERSAKGFRATRPRHLWHLGHRLPGHFATREEAERALDDLLADERATMADDNRSDLPVGFRGEQSFVYIAHDATTGFYKIGVSKDPEARLRALRTGNPRRIDLVAQMPGGYATERALHLAFVGDCMGGEWFFESAPLMALIGEWKVQRKS